MINIYRLAIILFIITMLFIYSEYYTHEWIKIEKSYLSKDFKEEHGFNTFSNICLEICDHCGLMRIRFRIFGSKEYDEIGYLSNYKRILSRYNKLETYIKEEKKEKEKRQKMKIRETNYNISETFNEESIKELNRFGMIIIE